MRFQLNVNCTGPGQHNPKRQTALVSVNAVLQQMTQSSLQSSYSPFMQSKLLIESVQCSLMGLTDFLFFQGRTNSICTLAK